MMGEVLPIRAGVEAAPTDLSDAIGSAYRKVSSKLSFGFCVFLWRQACTTLLNGIADNAARGMTVDQLGHEALALLRDLQQKRGADEYQR